MIRYWSRIWELIERQGKGEEPPAAEEDVALPTIWLLGKPGAGKSTFIRLMTGISEIEIGNGYEPCTRHSRLFRYPAAEPVLQFMDTAGIGEEGFDLSGELASNSGPGNAVIAVVRIDDPAIGDLCAAVRSVRNAHPRIHIVVVHSRADAISDKAERDRARGANHRAIEIAAGRKLQQIETGMGDRDNAEGVRRQILELLERELPLAAFLMKREERNTSEREEFSRVRNRVARHSLNAGAVAMMPIAGIPAELVIQARMLIELAREYDVPLNRDAVIGMGSALGVGVVMGRAAGMLGRQAGMMVPVMGQVAGPAVAAVTAFASTFAMGRASGYYFHQLKTGRRPNRAEIRRLYRSALRNARQSYKSNG